MARTDFDTPEAVLDASALLAHIEEEPGATVVRKAMVDGAAICVINWSRFFPSLPKTVETPNSRAQK